MVFRADVRRERPQKGRYRQFHHFGIEAFGMPGPGIDAEHIFMAKRLWEMLGLSEHLQLQINSLGTAESRARYREVLVEYFNQHYAELDEDSQRRLLSNPLRILDSKNPHMQNLIENAPKIIDYLDENAKQHFDGLLKLLDKAQVPYVVNTRLVRGLDYYGFTVYEWVTNSLGAQGTVCAGGRYNNLVEQLGGPSTPAVGFAIGLERLVLLLEKKPMSRYTPDVFVISMSEAATDESLLLTEKLRNDLPKIKIEVNLSAGNFKNQFKKADRSGAQWALILGEDELATGELTLKNLRDAGAAQGKMNYSTLVNFLKSKGDYCESHR